MSELYNLGVLAHFSSPWNIFRLWVLAHFSTKITQEKLLKLMKILKYSKSSCIIFSVKLLGKFSKKNLNYVKMTLYSQRFLNYIKWQNWLNIHKRFQVLKCTNTLKLYTLKALLSKNQFYFFFQIFWHAKNPPSLRMPRYWH